MDKNFKSVTLNCAALRNIIYWVNQRHCHAGRDLTDLEFDVVKEEGQGRKNLRHQKTKEVVCQRVGWEWRKGTAETT